MSAISPEPSGGLSSFPENSAHPSTDEQAPMPTFQYNERFSNGHDAEVAELPSPRSDGKSAPKKNWLQTAADWKLVLATLLAPAALALIYYLLPPTKSDLTAARAEASAALGVATTGISGQVKETRAELKGDINALAARVDGMQKAIDHTQSGVEELLRRSAPLTNEPLPTEASAPASPAPTPSRSIPPKDRPHKATVKRPVAPQQEGILSRLLR